MRKHKFIIYKPTKSAMQSGLNNTKKWCLTNTDINETYINSRFCWVGSSNPEKQVKLYFIDLESAKNFANKNNYDYEVIKPNETNFIKKSYSENFIKK